MVAAPVFRTGDRAMREPAASESPGPCQRVRPQATGGSLRKCSATRGVSDFETLRIALVRALRDDGPRVPWRQEGLKI
jgi:hypothetical protein